MSFFKMIVPFLFCSVIFSTTSCQKEDNSAEINSLKESVAALQKRSDSLASALAATNSNIGNLAKSVDSIKVQLFGISSQLTILNIQLNSLTANILTINAQITVLNQQYADLLAKLNLILSQLSITPTSLSTGLVAYYPFSGNAGDSSGNGYHGTLNNTTQSVDRFGNPNKSFSFDGVSNYFITPNNIYNTISSHSLSFWFKLNDVNTAIQYLWNTYPDHGIEAFVYNWMDGGKTNMNAITMCLGNGSVGSWNFTCGTEVIPVSSYQLNWVNMVLTSDNNVWKIFLNGKLVKQFSKAGDLPKINNGLIFGAGNTTKIFGFFKGNLDDIRIYNRALTQSEITYLAEH